MDVGRPNLDKDESHVSVIVIICLAIMALTFVVAIPLIGIALMDAHNATTIAVEEIKKMRELRLKMMLMMQGD